MCIRDSLVAVKGKNKVIKIFEVFDADLEKLKQLKIETLNDFKKGIKGYFEHNFENSLKYYSLKDDNLELIYTNALEEIKKKKSQLK